MLRSLIRCYRRHFKYAFLVAGIVYFGLLVVLVGLVEGVAAICGEKVSVMFERIVSVLNESFSQWNVETVRQLPSVWSQILEIIREETGAFRTKLIALGIGLAVLLVLSMVLARSVALFYLRNEGKNRSVLRSLAAILFRTGISLCFLFLALWLCTVRFWVAALIVAIWLLTKSIVSLIGYRLSGQTDLRLRSLLRVRTVLRTEGLYLLNALLTVVLAAILWSVMNLLFAALILLPFPIYFSCCAETECARIAVGRAGASPSSESSGKPKSGKQKSA